jgi:prophage regulatory protein
MTNDYDAEASGRSENRPSVAQISSSPGLPITGNSDAALRLPAVEKVTGLSGPTIWREIAKGRFPPPIMLTTGTRGWLLSEIQQWLTERRATRDAGLSSRRSPQLETQAAKVKVVAARRRRATIDALPVREPQQ